MPPRKRAGRGDSATAAGKGRTSSRLAEKKQDAAQHAAEQEAQQEREAAVAEAVSNLPHIESLMPPPPAPPSSQSRARSRPTESFARRGTVRRNYDGNVIASFSPVRAESASTSFAYSARQTLNDPSTPQRPGAGDIESDVWPEAVEETPRTGDAEVNLMNRFVDKLASVANDLMVHLAIEERDESWVFELSTYKNLFETIYRIYTLGKSVFIDIKMVERKTTPDTRSGLWQRMTRAVAIGNLANLLSDVEDLDDDSPNANQRMPLTQSIDEHFPGWFRSELVDSIASTMELSFLIRTHRFIETVRALQHETPRRLFAKVFLDLEIADQVTDEALGEQFSTASLKPFPGFDINGPDAELYRTAIEGFRDMAIELNHETIVNRLQNQYSFETFVNELKSWIWSSKNIEARVRREDTMDSSLAAADAQLQSEARASAAHDRLTSSGIVRLQQLKQHATAQQSQDSRAEAPAYDNNGDDDHVISTDGADYAQAAAATARPGVRKRPRKSGTDGDSAAKRARAADSSAMPPPSQPPAPLSSLPVANGFDPVALSRHSQLISKANRRPAQPRPRKPWTAHDTHQLVLAVDTYKAKWSTIEKAIKENHIAFNVSERDQQGLRDKARLVKVDLLKTDAVLPPSFDLVVLGRKEKEMVIAARRNPDRREADVGPDGLPVNTLYDPDFVPLDPSQQGHQQPDNNNHQDANQQEFNQQAHFAPESEMAIPDASVIGSVIAAGFSSLQQEADMTGDAPGVPDAPMMSTALEESASENSGSLNDDLHQSIDPNLRRDGPVPPSAQV